LTALAVDAVTPAWPTSTSGGVTSAPSAQSAAARHTRRRPGSTAGAAAR